MYNDSNVHSQLNEAVLNLFQMRARLWVFTVCNTAIGYVQIEREIEIVTGSEREIT